MFPTMEVNSLKIANCQRVVMVHYSSEENKFQFRHYNISQQPAGISKSVRNILKRDLPELGHLQDISQYLQDDLNGGDEDSSGSEDSDPEEKEENTVDAEAGGSDGVAAVAKVRGGGGVKKNVVKLREIGPRLELSLVKIEEGVCEGKVLYHAYVSKTEAEVAEMDNKKKQAANLKRKRRETQDANVQRKKSSSS
mmetsp:Transcript_19433/g.40910  ORF Transcript_19433/g.40910 Transcript_19433/m.40910 type:complete len:195 (+) Transcript_19433:60-644(+)